MKNILNFLLFQLTWFVSVWSIGQEIPYWGLLFVAGVLVFHLGWIATNRLEELNLIFKVVLLGGVVETLFSSLGLVSFVYASDYFPTYPPYMWGIWANFAMTFHFSMKWLEKRIFLAAGMGGVAGPLAYFAAEKLGAIDVQWNTYLDLAGLVVIWSLTMLIIVQFLMSNSKGPFNACQS
ncbi:MAG: DUF2878 domain-containing protein [SAR324 cluster bacterium]|nr:DUF2878 domain-containing protein [SAR324 cluster bacterium]